MLAVIGGSGYYDLSWFEEKSFIEIETEYGKPSAAILKGRYSNKDILFLARHGIDHRIPPHKINYRANIKALYECGVKKILSINAVGSCNEDHNNGQLLLPTQLIDYTCSRAHTFFDELESIDQHIDFTQPFNQHLQSDILAAAKEVDIELDLDGTYACTQGPRLETAAEVQRIKQDGCDLIGMTAMPEAALAKEQGIHYASLCVVVNPAAGITFKKDIASGSEKEISIEAISRILEDSKEKISCVIQSMLIVS